MLETIKTIDITHFYQAVLPAKIWARARKITSKLMYTLFEKALNDAGVLSPAQYKMLGKLLEKKVVPKKNLIKQYSSITKRNTN